MLRLRSSSNTCPRHKRCLQRQCDTCVSSRTLTATGIRRSYCNCYATQLRDLSGTHESSQGTGTPAEKARAIFRMMMPWVNKIVEGKKSIKQRCLHRSEAIMEFYSPGGCRVQALLPSLDHIRHKCTDPTTMTTTDFYCYYYVVLPLVLLLLLPQLLVLYLRACTDGCYNCKARK